MDYINISKVLDNYLSRCNCSGGDSRDESELVRGHQFSVKNISIIIFVVIIIYSVLGHLLFE